MVKKSRAVHWMLLAAFITGAMGLFAPVIHKYFVSDDFMVLNRVCLNRTLLIKGFFRPLSDLSIYGNYLLGGFRPEGFNLFNIAVHGLNSFLLYLFCLHAKWTANRVWQRRYAITAGILFLTYPFHNESIVWLLGRGSLLAGTFGIMAMILLMTGIAENRKITGVCLCYFTGLLAYESIIMLPLIMLVFLVSEGASMRRCSWWMLSLTLTLCFHFVLRILISGSVLGHYGLEMIESSPMHVAGNLFKVMGRLLLPPVQQAETLLLISAIVLLALIPVLVITFKRSEQEIGQKRYLLTMLLTMAIALVIPFAFGVSTKTTESDRFNYFPSFFLCGVAAFVMVRMLTMQTVYFLAIITVCTYNIYFLELSNDNWVKAGKATKEIIQVVKEDSSNNRLFIANLPGEFDGAFVFRLGFPEALLINKIDTSRIVLLNKISRQEGLQLPAIIVPQRLNQHLIIPPAVELVTKGNGALFLKVKDRKYDLVPEEAALYYWNNKELVRWK